MIVILGPAYPLRGGLASFDERLARAFIASGDPTEIYTFSLQYPSFLFPGTTQYSSDPAPIDLKIKVCISSINPFNWIRIGNELKNRKPDIIVVRYWLPFMGPCLGTILRLVKKNNHTKVICIADNILPHEKRIGDLAFTRYFLKTADAFITMSEKVMADLKKITQKPAKRVVHPLYDNFGEIVEKKEARQKIGIDPNGTILLFFGFIRKYKGLDLLLEAMKILKDKGQTEGVRLLIAGEFYEARKRYDALIASLGIGDLLISRTDFIPDSAVKYYLSAADFVIQPYREATQSGVTPLAYHFEKPMLVTNVGGLPDLVPDQKAGLVAEPNASSLAEQIFRLIQKGPEFFLPQLREEKKKYNWEILVNTIKNLSSK